MRGPTVPILLLSILALLAPNPSLGAICLAPVLGHNMVFQENEINVLRGTGPPGKQISARYKRANSKKVPIPQTGAWEIQLDLRKLSDKKPDRLEIRVEGEKAPLVLTNVAVGAVWLVAARPDQGVRADPRLSPNLDPLRIRFLSVTNADQDPLTQALPFGLTSWSPYSPMPPEIQMAPSIILRMAEALADGGSYVGVIQTTVNRLEPGSQSTSADPQSPEGKAIASAWLQASNDVHRAELARKLTLITAKQRGIVTNVPPVIPYGPACVCLGAQTPAPARDAFLNFRGAVWPQR